jgi:hypothetical protein
MYVRRPRLDEQPGRLASGSGRSLWQFGGNVPGKKLLDTIDRIVGDALEDVWTYCR